MSTVTAATEWITVRELACVLGVPIPQAKRIAARARLQRRDLPGVRPRWNRADALALAERSTTRRND